MPNRTSVTLLAAGLFMLLATGCGQKGPLYQEDEGSPVSPVVPAAGTDGAPAPAPAAQGEGTAPVTPGSPDRSDEPRKRIHTP
jgi:predicted small lipoprotein YifL